MPGADFTDDPGDNLGAPGNRCDNHGTLVAGIITAKINNIIGCVGIAPDCKVLPARIFSRWIQDPCNMYTNHSQSWIINALAWGFEQGARISNNSYGSIHNFYSNALREQFENTYNNGMIHFSAAGNLPPETPINFPARFSSVNAITSLSPNGEFSYFGTYGSGVVLCAPGHKIYTTDRTGSDGKNETDYSRNSGGSLATPYVAGVAALILSVEPWLTPPEIERRLLYSAVDYGEPGYDEFFGYGVVNAYRALKYTCGDCNGDFVVDINDVTCLKEYYFNCGPVPSQAFAGDMNCNERIDLADIILLAQHANGEIEDCCQ